MVEKKVSITLRGKDLASRALGKVRTTINRIKSAVFSLQGALVAVGVLVVGRITRSFVQAFTKQQDAVEGLRASLIATGKDGEDSLRRLTAHAAELQAVTKAGDEATIAATASLALLAPALDVPALERAQAAMIGLADVFFKGDLEAAALQIGKTVGGATNSLSRYGIQVDMAGDANARLNEILGQTNRFFDVSKARAQTLGGRLVRLGNSWGDLKERIGQFLGESKPVNQFLEDVRGIIEDLTGALNRGGPAVGEAFAALGELAGNAFSVAFLEVVELLKSGLDRLMSSFGDDIFAKMREKPAGRFLLQKHAEGKQIEEALDIRKGLKTFLRNLFSFGRPPRAGTQRIGSPPTPMLAPPPTEPSLLESLRAEHRAAGLAARERLAGAGAGFKAPPNAEELRRAELMARFGGQLPGVQGAVTRGVATSGVDMTPLLPRVPDMKALVTSSKEYAEVLKQSNALLEDARIRQEEAGRAAQAAAAAAVQAWGFAASQLIRSIQGGGLFDILGGIGGVVSLINPIAGGALLAGSAVGGALFDSGGRPLRVEVDRFGNRAESQLRDTQQGPSTLILQLIQDGVTIEEIEYELGRRQRTDQKVRIPRGVRF